MTLTDQQQRGVADMYENNFFTVQPWEQNAAQTVGITVSMFRFMLSFFASVAVGAGLRYVPTVTGDSSCTKTRFTCQSRDLTRTGLTSFS